MRKFGLIGYPLGHSFSKKYFTVKFSNENLHDCSYENYPINNLELLPGLVLSEPGLEGLNVTIPYKSEIIRFLNRIDDEQLGGRGKCCEDKKDRGQGEPSRL